MFTDLYSSKKIVSNLDQYRREMVKLIKNIQDDKHLDVLMIKFSYILNTIIDLEKVHTSQEMINSSKDVLSKIISELKPLLEKLVIVPLENSELQEIVKDYSEELEINKRDIRNIKRFKYFNDKIVGCFNEGKKSREKYNVFISDYDRIVSSSGVRRLQDKTQVYPLEQYDFPRTRLTHSHEVATTSELIIDLAFRMSEIKHEDRVIQNCKLIMRSASIIHDIGNPPFGHFGEDIIKSYFSELFEFKRPIDFLDKKSYISVFKEFSSQMISDFTNFDGNAQGLRVVSKLQHYKDSPLSLSASIIGAMIKYPNSSNEKKKYGYFFSEKNVVELLKSCHTYEENKKNPLSRILEAADDIANYVSDVEDGVKKGIISYERVLRVINKYKEANQEVDQEVEMFVVQFERLYELNSCYYNQFERTMNQLISGIKKKLINEIATKISGFINEKGFVINHEESDESLIEASSYGNLLKFIREEVMITHVYSDYQITKAEVRGFKIMYDLLDCFCDAVLNLNIKVTDQDYSIKLDKHDIKHKKRVKIFNMISPNFVNIFVNEINNLRYLKNQESDQDAIYHKLRLVVDFISGMTDNYIVDFHEKIFSK